MGRLADEYFPENGLTYNGDPAGNEANLAGYSTEQAMTNAAAKWYRWLDSPGIGVHQGGGGDDGWEFGVFRPSDNSIMRGGTEFDVVGREQLIFKIYQQEDISIIVDADPAGNYNYDHKFSIDRMNPTHALDPYYGLEISWYVDGLPVQRGVTEQDETLDYFVPNDGETHTVRVEVIDLTDMVRDEDSRAMYLKDSREWTVGPNLFVTTNEDVSIAEDGILSLREALALAANETNYPGANTITFAPHVNEIQLDEQLIVNSNVSLVGPGWNALTIDGGGSDRVFNIGSSATVSMSGLSIENGGNVDLGAGIYNAGNLSLEQVRVRFNITNGSALGNDQGGGIYSLSGSLHISNSEIELNEAKWGAGIAFHATSASHELAVVNSTIANNTAQYVNGYGTWGGLRISSTTNAAPLKIVNSTISGNKANANGGLGTEDRAHLLIVNSTITDNEAVAGTGGGVDAGWQFSTITMHNTIVADNHASIWGGIYRDLVSNGGIFDSNSSFNLIGGVGNSGLDTSNGIIDPPDSGLKPLAYYGGPLKTHSLEYSSPAIDRGSDDEAEAAFIELDQRDYVRFFDDPNKSGSGGIIDIGAVEYSTARIENVIFSSTEPNDYNSNPPYEFDGVVGNEAQLQTIPVGGVSQIAIQFSRDVIVAQNDLEVIALNNDIEVPTILQFIPASLANDFTATWTFQRPATEFTTFKSAQYLLRVYDSIVDLDGNGIDGDWTNPTVFDLADFIAYGPSQVTSEFPSGNRIAGGDFEFVFTILRADVTRDNRVQGGDYGIIELNLNDPPPFTFLQGDVTGNGRVTNADYAILELEYQKFDFRSLRVLGDFNHDFDVDDAGTDNDQAAFDELYENEHSDADLNGDNLINQEDVDLFAAILARGIALTAFT